jgi:hypothetical protein
LKEDMNISVIESQIYTVYTSKDIYNLLTPTFRSIKSTRIRDTLYRRRFALSEDKTKVKVRGSEEKIFSIRRNFMNRQISIKGTTNRNSKGLKVHRFSSK